MDINLNKLGGSLFLHARWAQLVSRPSMSLALTLSLSLSETWDFLQLAVGGVWLAVRKVPSAQWSVSEVGRVVVVVKRGFAATSLELEEATGRSNWRATVERRQPQSRLALAQRSNRHRDSGECSFPCWRPPIVIDIWPIGLVLRVAPLAR